MRVAPHAVVAVLLVSGGALLGSSVQGIAALDATVKALPVAPRVLPATGANVREGVSTRAEPTIHLRAARCLRHHHRRANAGPEI